MEKFPMEENQPAFKMQLCHYKSSQNGPWQLGIAKLTHSFNDNDVQFIMNQDGVRVEVYDYRLLNGERCLIDSHMENRVGF